MNYADQAHFGNYSFPGMGWPTTPDLVPLIYTSPITGAVTIFGHCARAFRPVAIAILTELEPHVLGGYAEGAHDDWAYATTDDLPDGSPSAHHCGCGFDLNWRKNPMGQYRTNPYAGQRGAIPTAIAIEIARKYGCEYGGQWSGGDGVLGFKDYMHFECHLHPDVAITVKIIDPPEGFTMDAEVKAAFAALNARLDALPADVWQVPLRSQSDGKPHPSGVILTAIDKHVNDDIQVDATDLAVDRQDATQDVPKGGAK